MKYEVFRGHVSGVEKESWTEVDGKISKGKGSIKTQLKTRQTFKINDKSFELHCSHLLEDDDEVVVAVFKKKDGYFMVTSCRNFTKEWIWTSSIGLWVVPFIVVPISFVIGILISKENPVFATIFMIIASLISFYLIYPTRKAYKELEKMQQETK